jgi:hypothetical protein
MDTDLESLKPSSQPTQVHLEEHDGYIQSPPGGILDPCFPCAFVSHLTSACYSLDVECPPKTLVLKTWLSAIGRWWRL